MKGMCLESNRTSFHPFNSSLFFIDSPFPLNERLCQKTFRSPQIDLLQQVQDGLKYYPPVLSSQGIGGTYFLRNSHGKVCAVFKPIDEEPGMPNCPKKGHLSLTSPWGVLPGEGALREYAAYLLDHRGFAGVPETHMVTLCHPNFCHNGTVQPKKGSLQQFVQNQGVSWDMGPSRFLVEDVHKIGLLDIRLFNLDRNGSNILVQKEDQKYRLIPIDHAYCLPHYFCDAMFEWQFWPQARQPFNETTIRYIEEIDIQTDANILKSIGIKEDCINIMTASTLLLKKGVRAGLTLCEIACLMVKRCGESKAPLYSLWEGLKCYDGKNYMDFLDKSLDDILSPNQ